MDEIPDYPPPEPPGPIQEALGATREEIRTKRTYVRLTPKTDEPEDLIKAVELEKAMNDAIAETPALLAEHDRMMAEVRERYKRFLLYGEG